MTVTGLLQTCEVVGVVPGAAIVGVKTTGTATLPGSGDSGVFETAYSLQ